MKITLSPYQNTWKEQFETIRNRLQNVLLELHPAIEHIGSTSVENLSAKPIIDVNVGVEREEDFETVVARMGSLDDFIYYEVFNATLPQRRLFVQLREPVTGYGFKKIFSTLEEIPHDALNELRVAHVHVWVYGTEDWIRHLAFRDYLRAHEDLKNEYEQLKHRLSRLEWPDGMAYNQAKDHFIKKVEADAIRWYKQRNA